MKWQVKIFQGVKVVIFILSFNVSFVGFCQLNLPNTSYFNQTVDQIYLTDSITYYQTHLAAKPINDLKTNAPKIYKTDKEYYYWVTQKLFKEHFLIFEGEDYWCAIDPVLDLEYGTDSGTDLSADSIRGLYWNTRGIRIQAKFFENFALETTVYESQAILPEYQSKFVNQHGEFVPNFNNTLYKQQNGMIPGYSRTKSFGTRGYDFAFAEGYVAYNPNTWMTVQLGNGNQFIGHGHRSLLLSDFTSNYPYLKPEFFAFEGRLQYSMIFAALQNLYRLPYHATPEANFESNNATFHYLEYAVNKQFQIGIFEGNIWKSLDSSKRYALPATFFNPVIGLNSMLNGTLKRNYNSVFGLNTSYAYESNIFYGQLLFDQSSISGFQFGVKSYNIITDHLNLKVEYNQAKPNSYLNADKRLNFAHNNLPLAHPYTAGFKEGIISLDYNYQSFFITNKFIYSERMQNDSLNYGVSVLSPLANLEGKANVNVVLNQLEMGYRFNKNYNLQLYLGYLYRKELSKTNRYQTDYLYFGIRTKLKNKTLDW